MNNNKLRALLKESDLELYTPEDQSVFTPLDSCITNVMAAYQNANKWLDIIKEDLLINKGTVFFSEYVHNLAHTMPVRFDAFGDILHTRNMLIPYPPTAGIPYTLGSCDEIFTALFSIIDEISIALRAFIKCTQDTELHSMACKAEELLISIDSENENLYRMLKVYEQGQDLVKFDKWVRLYLSK